VESSDLISYGLIPEFIGRFPVLVSLSALNEDQLVQVIVFVEMVSSFINLSGHYFSRLLNDMSFEYALAISQLIKFDGLYHGFIHYGNCIYVKLPLMILLFVTGSHRAPKRSWETVQEDVRHE